MYLLKRTKLGYEAGSLCIVPPKIMTAMVCSRNNTLLIVVPETLGFEAVNACRRVKGIGRMGAVN